MAKVIEKKVTLKHSQPNVLIKTWLLQLLENARETKSKLVPMLELAFDSISKYPVQLNSGAECIILKGFGKKLCKILDECIEAYNAKEANNSDPLRELSVEDQNGRCDSPMTESSSSSSIPVNKYIPVNNNTSPKHPLNRENLVRHDNSFKDSDTPMNGSPEVDLLSEVSNNSNQCHLDNPTSTVPNRNSAKKSSAKKYKPAFLSGGYAILVALREHAIENIDKPAMSKEELIEKAQLYSKESFVRPKPNTHYTAWSNMSRLITKGLVQQKGKRKAVYSLTQEGMEIAQELYNEAKHKVTDNDLIFNNDNEQPMMPDNLENDIEEDDMNEMDTNDNEPSTSQSENVFIDLAPGSFEIILLVDKCETGGLRKKYDPTIAQFNKYPDMKYEVRSLKVGDFTWVARHNQNVDQELVLPFVVERKRMDDLAASIKDGRFHEQKFRLRKCGLDNVIYLVEDFGNNKNVGLPLQNLKQALANTRVQDGFKVHTTDSLTNSVRFLAMMTKRLIIRFKDKHLRGYNKEPRDDYLMTFDYFNKSSAKNKALTVTETFIKILLQLKGLSVEKALAITRKYPTPRSLIKAYQKCDANEGQALLTYLKYSELSPNVGPVISKAIYNIFSSINA
ncbi:unnamed protein product [Chrysodeixis includens]|uniref:Crossover junction endonuclease MUS81 n=1 Tax=Chrysodeixis includens TaxID=689277 RepID=A0A9P0BPZ4_CHRIL|nr:unnamed protein product [Chrysodeixis includens]